MKSTAADRRVNLWRAASPFGSAALVILFGVITYASTRRESASTRLVDHTHRAIEGIDAVLARVVDAETGQRGFIITGDSVYLQPYYGAVAEIDLRLATLRELASDNPRQLARLDTLAALLHKRVDMLAEHIATYRHAGFDTTRTAVLRTHGGKTVMDSARALIGLMKHDELALLTARGAEQRSRERTVLIVVIVGTILAAVIALLVNLMLVRAAARESRLASELAERADELEGQVAETEMLSEELQTTNEQLERRTEEAEEANSSKARFLANMSHDLRTPLNAIVGYVDLLEMGIRGPVTTEQHADLQRIRRSSAHLLGLVNEVLEFAKLEAGQLHLHIVDTQMEDVLSGLQPLVSPQAEVKQLKFTTECDAELLVRADPEKLAHILVNLVTNAIKFTESGGRIDVISRESGSWVRTDVSDTGRGIPAEQLESVFEPFVQVEHRDRRQDSHGIGLGLSISRELARMMGGDLTVKSEVGEGSTFTLLLPRATNEKPRD